jgi:nitrite reductase/ring-hydroxylating ferredoxin subunit
VTAEDRDDEQGWVLAMPIAELGEGALIGVQLEGANVLLVNLGEGELRAYDNRCPHASAPLSEGDLSATTLRCAFHHWEFDIRTGAALEPRNCMLRRYPVKVVDAAVLVRLRSS